MAAALNLVREYLTPVLARSGFEERGVLTPEEFVRAGDELVAKCPTWQWAAGDKALAKAYLPPEKQYLITRRVPSLRRARALALGDEKEEVLESGGDAAGGEGWLAMQADHAHHEEAAVESLSRQASGEAVPEEAAAVRLGELNIKEDYALNPVSLQQAGQRRDAAAASSEAKKKEEGREKSRADEAAKAQAEEDDGEDDVPDMEAFEEDNLEEDPAALPASKAQRAPAAGGDMLRAVEPEEEFVRTRTYDLSIAYDKYYQTPHVYLFGYDENGQPLTSEQILQDVREEHANKTVTFEAHPHTGLSHASVHPCKHGAVMRRIVDLIQTPVEREGAAAPAAGAPPRVTVEQYLFIFLKFISTVIPTIEYDFTFHV